MVLAMKRIYGPDNLRLGVGPVIENGFYQDFDILPDRKGDHEVVEGSNPQSESDSSLKGNISEKDFPKIESEMKKIISEGLFMVRAEVHIKEAIEYFESKGQVYKVELLKDIDSKGSSKMNNEAEANAVANLTDAGKVSFYYFTKSLHTPEQSFQNAIIAKEVEHIDLCRGPHVANTKDLKHMAFKLDRIAGSYWRGSEKNPMLTRIYAVAFESQEELDNYYKLQEEAKKRDHRVLGKQLGIFHFNDKVGPGLPLWLPNGAIIVEELEALAKETELKGGYKRVRTPHITKEDLYITSGHLPYYQDSMYPPMDYDGEKYYLKPMNCPHHHMIFASSQRSYKELPLRLAEYGHCYRHEDSGALFGLMRVRSLCMNDAHIYCTEEQFESEFDAVNKMYLYYFKIFGIDKYVMRLSLHSKDKLGQKYVNEPELWIKTEEMVRNTFQKLNIPYVEVEDEAAFYGPKIDVQVWSVIGREFTLATNQVDFAVPARFGLEYIDKDGERKTPLCIHRAPLGTHERFIGFLIEHFAGNFPLWLSPVQVAIIPISNEKHGEYAIKIKQALLENAIRVEVYDENETLGNRIRKAKEMKVNYIVVVGDKEIEANSLTIRNRKDEQVNMKVEEFINSLTAEVKAKRL
ncbi:threonine--tRNA ligase [bacterium]|nr:MAG: threonine--tRNA ligase [bacterium]